MRRGTCGEPSFPSSGAPVPSFTKLCLPRLPRYQALLGNAHLEALLRRLRTADVARQEEELSG